VSSNRIPFCYSETDKEIEKSSKEEEEEVEFLFKLQELKQVERLLVVCLPYDSVWENRMAVVLCLPPQVIFYKKSVFIPVGRNG